MSPPTPVTPVRKSGRARQPNKKYSVDAFAGLDILDSVSDEEAEAWEQLENNDNDEEFDEAKSVEEVNDPEEDEISSAEAVSDGSGIATPLEDSGDAAVVDESRTEDHGNSLTGRKTNYNYHYRQRRNQEAGTHIRGIADPVGAKAKGSKADHLYSLFGNATADLLHMARSRDQWADTATLPRRPNESGSRGMRHFFSHTEEKRRMESTVGWDWYYIHGGRQHMARLQQSQSLSPQEGIEYIPHPSHPRRTIFMGPYGRQSRFDLPFLQTMPIGEAWKNAPAPNLTEEVGPGRPRSQKGRDGWVLNVGTGVRCLDWAPNHLGDTQYLALSTLQPKSNESFGQSKFSPAFTAQSFPSSVQIWSFSSCEAPDRKSLLDPDHPPRLRLVICTDWGDAKHLKWCPMPRDFPEEGQEGKIPIGLLAAVWSDGHVRVLDIHLDNTDTQDTHY
ncbi:MAG: hypothetical protein Q9201_005636, partial [Fulgogasparrea decipioides]